jgi:malonyl-CoA O-methyltransferase
MNVREAYTAWSPTYDAVENPTRDLDLLATRETLGQLRFQSILELGCGTGKNTALLTQIGKRVQAVDFSAGMLAQAQAKIQASNVTFATGDITQPWPYANQTFDLIVTNLVLEHIADLAFVFAEAQRCLQPNGHFFVSELHPYRQYGGLQANFERAGERIDIPAFVHHLSDFVNAAAQVGLRLERLQEWWKEQDTAKPPLLVSFLFAK